MNRIRNIIAIIAAIVSLNGNTASALTAMYTDLGVTNINSSFKTWMDYGKIANESSAQYKFIKKWGWVDKEGFMRCSAETDLGVTDDYYLVALGSYYGTNIGTKYKITTDTGNVFYVALAEHKADIHTNSTHQYGLDNNDVLEFLIDDKRLNKLVMIMGSANVYMPLNGSIVKIEQMEFVRN